MGFRFHRSVKLFPGFRLNFSSSGVSTSIGPRGASVTMGKRGVYVNIGIPGTGISYREKISSAEPGTQAAQKQRTAAKRTAQQFQRESQREEAENRNAELKDEADRRNNEFNRRVDIFLETPVPGKPFQCPMAEFDELKPTQTATTVFRYMIRLILCLALLTIGGAIANRSGLIAGAILSTCLWIADDRHLRKQFEQLKFLPWQQRKNAFEKVEEKKFQDIDDALTNADKEPENALTAAFSLIEWPYETNVSYQIDGTTAYADVDLPEIEDLPDEEATITGRGTAKQLTTSPKGVVQQRQDYARHVHGIGMVISGTIFNALPSVQTVIISAYSQRMSATSGRIEDEYLYSVKIPRPDWMNIDFDHLQNLNPIDILSRFDIRRRMTLTGVFKPVEPFGTGD